MLDWDEGTPGTFSTSELILSPVRTPSVCWFWLLVASRGVRIHALDRNNAAQIRIICWLLKLRLARLRARIV